MPGTQQIVGIASGLDSTGIVDALIAFERKTADQIEQRQAETTNQVTSLKALQAKILALDSQIAALRKAATFEAANINVSDDSYLSATRAGRVNEGSWDMRVLSLARSHQMASQGIDNVDSMLFGTGTIKIGIGSGTDTITIDSSNNSLIGIKEAINATDAGVTASIINDGTESNSYRLLLQSDKTGSTKQIYFESSLGGGLDLDFTTSSFDEVEEVSLATGTTSTMSLGAGAAYTGSENKTYTFTVQGAGEQTVGTDTITINWTDGTNSGSFDITAEDTEVELTGDGSDGLFVQFAAGDVTAGDVFQVNTFTPLLQEASDAKIALGSSGGVGSPIVVTSSTNGFSDVIAGLSITAKKVTPVGESITINTSPDVTTVKAKIKGFMDAYNDVVKWIDDQNTYSQDTGESGALFGDSTLWTAQAALRNRLSAVVEGIDSKYNQLYSIGIRHSSTGQLAITNYDDFEQAIQNNLDDVINLFGDSGVSSTHNIEFLSLGSTSTTGSDLEVDITAAATTASLVGSAITDPALIRINPGVEPPAYGLVLDSTNNRLRLKIDGVTSEEIQLTQKTYESATELINELQAQIDADAKIGSFGLEVSWDSDANKITIAGSTYGSTASVELVSGVDNNAHTVLGLESGTSTAGTDVAGTINGEEAVGRGRYLTGKEDNETTEGIKLLITFTEDQVGDGVEGTIKMARGIATQLHDSIDNLTKSKDGVFDRRISALEKQIEQMAERVVDIDERLEIRRESLLKEFWAMESALGEMNALKDYLTQQTAMMNQNWKLGTNR
ncbi:MAG: flagellar filament capping protein FliD [bacterium]